VSKGCVPRQNLRGDALIELVDGLEVFGGGLCEHASEGLSHDGITRHNSPLGPLGPPVPLCTLALGGPGLVTGCFGLGKDVASLSDLAGFHAETGFE
jgi:hypothetical protein